MPNSLGPEFGEQRGCRHRRSRPRVFDINCGWAMYRVLDADSFRYKCGLYQQSHGQRCHPNHINGPLATSFILGCVRQRLLSLNVVTKLETRLQQLAAAELRQERPEIRGSASRQELDQVRRELKLAERNLALAHKNENQFRAIAAIVEELRERETSLELATKTTAGLRPRDVDSEVDAALRLADLSSTIRDQFSYRARHEGQRRPIRSSPTHLRRVRHFFCIC